MDFFVSIYDIQAPCSELVIDTLGISIMSYESDDEIWKRFSANNQNL